MKKLLSIILSLSIVLSLSSTVLADTITFVDGEDQKTETQQAETQNTDTVSKEPVTLEVTPNTTFVALGKDLTEAQQKTVLSLMGISPDKLQNCNVVYVTNEEEHQYLDSYIGSSIIGHKSLSSVLVRPASTGHGVTVKTSNINYCTEAMYQNALITAGVTDADVMVVGPSPISGTAALIGALKAYSQMSGKPVNEKALDTALNELVTTGDVKDAVGDDEVAAQLISYIKAQVAANDLNTKEEIEAAVRQGDKDFNANLSEEQIKEIVEVMVKIKEMGIDFNVLAEQADSLYAKYGDQIKAGTFTLDSVDWNDLGIGKVITNAVNDFVENVGGNFKKFMNSIFK